MSESRWDSAAKKLFVNTILSVEPNPQDRRALESIFHESAWTLCPGSRWRLKAAPTLAAALSAVQRTKIPVVVCECDRRPGLWKQILQQFTLLPNAPLLIVTSRLADDRLWVEALNLGAYDVLAKPFDRREVVRTISLAWLRWTKPPGVPSAEIHVMKAAG